MEIKDGIKEVGQLIIGLQMMEIGDIGVTGEIGVGAVQLGHMVVQIGVGVNQANGLGMTEIGAIGNQQLLKLGLLIIPTEVIILMIIVGVIGNQQLLNHGQLVILMTITGIGNQHNKLLPLILMIMIGLLGNHLNGLQLTLMMTIILMIMEIGNGLLLKEVIILMDGIMEVGDILMDLDWEQVLDGIGAIIQEIIKADLLELLGDLIINNFIY